MANGRIEAVVDSVGVKLVSRVSLALVIPLSLWGLTILANTHDEVVILRTQMTERTSDRYSGTDARKDMSVILSLIARDHSDIANLVTRQADDEKFMYQHNR